MVSHEAVASRRADAERAPQGLGGQLRILGPGLVLAATTVGVGDLFSSMVAGQEHGFTFVWAILLASALK